MVEEARLDGCDGAIPVHPGAVGVDVLVGGQGEGLKDTAISAESVVWGEAVLVLSVCV